MTRILYVEDEPFLAKIVKETLEAKSYQVMLIEDGAKAIDQFQKESYDICVLDIMLPHKNGFEIAKEIRQISAEVPILFLTAKDQTPDVIKGFKIGGNDYIRKPFSMEELMIRIENLLSLMNNSTLTNQKYSEIRIGTLYTFCPKKYELKFGVENQRLSHRESQILELLTSNLSLPTERKEILLKVWGDDSFYNSRNLDVYITKLRSYLKKDPNINIITLKGVGYKFIIDQ